MENTFGKKPLDAPKKDTSRKLPASRTNEHVEPVKQGSAEVSDNGRLQQSISVGRKPETYEAKSDDIEGLRPASSEIKNG